MASETETLGWAVSGFRVPGFYSFTASGLRDFGASKAWGLDFFCEEGCAWRSSSSRVGSRTQFQVCDV